MKNKIEKNSALQRKQLQQFKTSQIQKRNYYDEDDNDKKNWKIKPHLWFCKNRQRFCKNKTMNDIKMSKRLEYKMSVVHCY